MERSIKGTYFVRPQASIARSRFGGPSINSKMFLPLEGEAKTGRRARPLTNRLPPGDDHQNGDGEKVGKHSQDVRRNKGKLPGLEVKLKGIDPAEEQCSEDCPPWIP